jgi:hypothetical protein
MKRGRKGTEIEYDAVRIVWTATIVQNVTRHCTSPPSRAG